MSGVAPPLRSAAPTTLLDIRIHMSQNSSFGWTMPSVQPRLTGLMPLAGIGYSHTYMPQFGGAPGSCSPLATTFIDPQEIPLRNRLSPSNKNPRGGFIPNI